MRSLAALTLLLLASCATPSPEPPAFGDPNQACNDDRLSSFIGSPATQQTGADMLRASGARTIRWVPVGGVITMDFNPTRLTVQLDQQNRVSAAKCG